MAARKRKWAWGSGIAALALLAGGPGTLLAQDRAAPRRAARPVADGAAARVPVRGRERRPRQPVRLHPVAGP